MPNKRVVIIASGDTERRALPHLCRDLYATGIEILEPVRTIVLRTRTSTRFADRLRSTIKSAWHDHNGKSEPPSKFVILVDADGRPKEAAIASAREACRHLHDIPVPCLVTAAKWHLEAWFFADEQKLREFLGRDLGNISPQFPDEILNPKLHLKNLLSGRRYTREIADRIASVVRPSVMQTHSQSFFDFVQAVRNGDGFVSG